MVNINWYLSKGYGVNTNRYLSKEHGVNANRYLSKGYIWWMLTGI